MESVVLSTVPAVGTLLALVPQAERVAPLGACQGTPSVALMAVTVTVGIHATISRVLVKRAVARTTSVQREWKTAIPQLLPPPTHTR